MYKHSYTAKVGFVKTLDRTCAKCGGMYSSNERHMCPKCNAALVAPTHAHAKGPRPYLFTEVTLYPMMRQEDRKDFETRTERSNSLAHWEVKVVLWGRFDEASNTAMPDNRVQYLVPKRTVRAEFNSPPLLRPYTSHKNNGQQRVEFKYVLNSNRGDQIEFLDSMQAAQTIMNEAESAGAQNTTPVTPVTAPAGTMSPEQLQAQLNTLIQAVAAMNSQPAATPEPAPVHNYATTVMESPVPTESTPQQPMDLDAEDGGINEIDAAGTFCPFPTS